MTTAARTTTADSAHWYTADGKPMHTVKAKAGHDRPTTLADAKKLRLLPSPTSLLQILDKPALTTWKIEQAVLSVLTASRKDGEEIDAFVQRVLHTEKQQEQEGQAARDLGTEVHAAIERFLTRASYAATAKTDDDVWAMAKPACEWADVFAIRSVEKVLIGAGYAGKVDAIFADESRMLVVDFKTTSKLPKASYPEHRLQLSAYAAAWQAETDTPPNEIVTVNVYISKTEPGKIQVCENYGWLNDFAAFEKVLDLWCYMKGYDPRAGELSVADKISEAGL